jgi:hypothetical protein
LVEGLNGTAEFFCSKWNKKIQMQDLRKVHPASAVTIQSCKCNRAYATNHLRAIFPRLLLRIGNVIQTLADALSALAKSTQKCINVRSQPRPKHRAKPHPSQVCKG